MKRYWNEKKLVDVVKYEGVFKADSHGEVMSMLGDLIVPSGFNPFTQAIPFRNNGGGFSAIHPDQYLVRDVQTNIVYCVDQEQFDKSFKEII